MAWWFYAIYLIIAVAAVYAAQPKSSTPDPSTIEDVDAPTAEEGSAIPVVFGTYVVQSPNIVWYGDLGYKSVKSSSGK